MLEFPRNHQGTSIEARGCYKGILSVTSLEPPAEILTIEIPREPPLSRLGFRSRQELASRSYAEKIQFFRPRSVGDVFTN